MLLTVSTLDGHALEVHVDPTGCVKDIRRCLTEQYGLGKCSLYLQARQLPMKATLSELGLQDGDRLTALTTLGTAVTASASSRRQATAAAAAEPQSPTATAAAAPPHSPAQHSRTLDTLLPGYASRPNPSPVKLKQQPQLQQQLAQKQQQHGAVTNLISLGPATAAAPSVLLGSPSSAAAAGGSSSAAAVTTAAEAAGLSGGGFMLTEQQQQQHGRGADTDYGRLPTYNSSRQRQGRTLLQQHIMMQHDLKQQHMLELQQRQGAQLGVQHQSEQQQRQPQQHLRSTADGHTPTPVELCHVQEASMQHMQQDISQACSHHAAGKAGSAAEQQEATSVKLEQQQQPTEQQVQPVPSFVIAPQSGLLPPSLSRSQHDALLSLPLPKPLQHLLVLHLHLESCYSFLLQQHILPRWGRLAAMMMKLFPQDQFTLHHLILMAQIAPHAVLLLQPPDNAHKQNEQQQYDPWSVDQRVPAGSYPVHDRRWQGAQLTATEVAALEQQLLYLAAAQKPEEERQQHLHFDTVGDVSLVTAEQQSASAGHASTAAASKQPEQHIPSVAAAAAAATESFDVLDIRVLLVDPGPNSSKGRGRKKRTLKDDDDDDDDDDDEARQQAAEEATEANHALPQQEHERAVNEPLTDNAASETAATTTAAAAAAAAMLQPNKKHSRNNKKQKQQMQQDQPDTAIAAVRYGSGSRTASVRRQRRMASAAATAVWLVHRQFLQQLAQQLPQQQQPRWTRHEQQQGEESLKSTAAEAAATLEHNDLNHPAAVDAMPESNVVTGAVATRRKRQNREHQQQQQETKHGVSSHRRSKRIKRGAANQPPAESGHKQDVAAMQHQGAAVDTSTTTPAAAVRGSGKLRQSKRNVKPREGTSCATPQQDSMQHAAVMADVECLDTQQDGIEHTDALSDSGSDAAADMSTKTTGAAKRSARPKSKRRATAAKKSQARSAAAAALNYSDSVDASSWDALKQRSWHAQFDEQQVTLQDLITAVSAHRAWLQQAAGHATEQQQQQQQFGSGGAGASSVSLVARPTRTMARHKACSSCEPLRPEQFLEHLKSLSWYQDQVVHVQHTPARLSRHLATTHPLAPSTHAALATCGIQQLFAHQAAAVDALCLKQRHVVVATSTASGKSLCYNVPMLEALARDRTCCGLFLFPTKALAQDQLRVLRQLMTDAFGVEAPCVEIYDGDTPHADRPAIRSRAQLLITNPDMLHQSILPCHNNFARLLEKVAYVVVDEGHAYRGVFGCHAALVLRRLRRLCERTYGNHPLFVVTSATIANPLEHAALLLGVATESIMLIDEDGSPHGPKDFVLWNPPLTAQAQQAVAAGEGGVVLTRTELRGGSAKLKKEMARTVARESIAARRRGVALHAAAGVTEAEWAAAVRLGHTAAAAKTFLFDNKHSNLSMALAATVDGTDAATLPSAVTAPAAVLDEHDSSGAMTAVEHDSTLVASMQQQQQQQDKQQWQQQNDGVIVVDVVTDNTDGAQQQHHKGQALVSAAATTATASSAGIAAKLPRQVQQEACAALAAVEAAADAVGSTAAAGHSNRRQIRKPTHVLPVSRSGVAAGSGGGSLAADGSRSTPRARAACGTALSADVQRQIEEALPPRGEFKERYGAAGTPVDQRRESPIVEMSLLLTEAVMHGLRTIAFCKSRKLCELVAAYTRENLKSVAPSKSNLVKVYRAGYSPAERRQLEADLHSGALTAVAATNALELGIDVGSLDLTLHLGFPGSVASLWQQAGRAGRRSQASVSLYVAFDGPLDQHFMTHPQELFQRPIECVQLDPCNAIVLNSHLVCAAKELPLLPVMDGVLFGVGQLAKAATELKASGLLGRHPTDPPSSEALHYIGRAVNPAADISLRTIDPERFIIYNTADNSVLEEIEANMAFYEIYDGAIYLYQGRPYICTALSLETRVAQVRPADVRWYTKVRDYTDIHVTGARVAYPTAHAALAAIAARKAHSGGGTTAAGAVGAVKHEVKTDVDAAAAVVSSRFDVAVKPEQFDDGLQAAYHNNCTCCPQAAAAGAGNAAASSDMAITAPVDSSVTAAAGAALPTTAVCESCVITVRFMGYFRVHQGTGQVFDAIDLFVPDTQFETQACYLRLPPSARRACQAANIPFREAVHAASHALLNVLPLYMVCNSTDMGTECDNPYDTRFRPERILLYDKHPGGIGLAAQATPLFPELLQQALDLVQHCPCSFVKGCPCCVQHLDCKNYNAVLNKEGAVLVLREALQQELQGAT